MKYEVLPADSAVSIPRVIAKFKGDYFRCGRQVTCVGGGWLPDQVRLIEFGTMEALRPSLRSPR